MPKTKDRIAVCPKCGMETSVHPDGTMYAHGKFKKEGTYIKGIDFPVIWCDMSDKPAPQEER
jgi:hypothetical protein